MKIFYLPDLGEGLPDAVIREWHVSVGDEIKIDEPLVSMETAKALVDVPAPYDGVVEKLFGAVSDTIETASPLVGFIGEDLAVEKKDAGTVVGNLETDVSILQEASPDGPPRTSLSRERLAIKILPAVRLLAKRLGVDLNQIKAAADGYITRESVEKAAAIDASKTSETAIDDNFLPLSRSCRLMAEHMTRAHASVVPVTLVDDADVSSWNARQDMTIRMIRAVQQACMQEPSLNASFDGLRMKYRDNANINLGLALDTPHALYVPVLRDIQKASDAMLRTMIEHFKVQAQNQAIPQEALQDATITLSNFGALAGRYATPIILPPMVAIIGVGRARDAVVADAGKPAIHRILPLSLTVDHRAITGGQAARFLKVLIDTLMLPA